MIFSLPVIVYHHVNNLNEDISESQFDEQMAYLVAQGYRTIFLKDWITERFEPDGRTVAITFDDGYLDNWVYAYPILKKYGLNATIFVTTVRCLNSLPYRPSLEDAWSGNVRRESLPEIASDWEANRFCVLKEVGNPHFLTWDEMQAMEASGVIDIQSHTHYHRDFFVSDQIVDFNQNKYFGLAWATDGDTRYGIPIYPRKSAMRARRYFDDERLRDYLADHVSGPEFFANRSRREYMKELLGLVEKYKRTHVLTGKFESLEDQRWRTRAELHLSKTLIEKKLAKSCHLICWPWGEYSHLSIDVAREVGFLGAVAFSPGPNRIGTEAGVWRIKRFAPTKNLEKFAKRLAAFSSVRQSVALSCYSWAESSIRKINRRIASGDIRGSIKRKLSGHF